LKALSIKQPWAGLIAHGIKTIETRIWTTKYRGDILICASKTKDQTAWDATDAELKQSPAFKTGVAVCVAELYDIQPMTSAHTEKAMCGVYTKAKSWFLRNVRRIDPVPVTGKRRLFDVENDILS